MFGIFRLRREDVTNLTKALNGTREHSSSLSKNLEQLKSCPIPVQTFPLVDNFEWEDEKNAAAVLAVKSFDGIQDVAIKQFSAAHDTVDRAFCEFFELLDKYGDKVDRSKTQLLKDALDKLIACSPKKVVGNFQKLSLDIGWAYVASYNSLIDALAGKYPRCRAGIFGSRLNYADVLQISEEVLATLRATSTVLEDVQRRYDLLEGLQAEFKADADWTEMSKLWEAMKGCYTDTEKHLNPDGAWYKKVLSVPTGGLMFAMGAAALPNAQFQGQLSREQRTKVFIATAAMVKQGWSEWLKLNREVVAPNLQIMFALKGDFAQNKMLGLCDVLTTNGYSLDGLTSHLTQVLGNKATIQLQQ